MKQMAPTELEETEAEPEVETTEPEMPETGEAENVAEEFDPYAVAIAAAEAVLMEDER